MSDYHIKYIDGKANLVDAAGVPIDEDAAAIVLEDLLQQYKLRCSVYVAYSPSTELYKIGMSRNVARRMSELRTTLVHEIECRSIEAAWHREYALHKIFKMFGKHIDGEWFSLDADDLSRIRSVKWSRFLEFDFFSILMVYMDVVVRAVKADGDNGVEKFRGFIGEQLKALDRWDAEFDTTDSQ